MRQHSGIGAVALGGAFCPGGVQQSCAALLAALVRGVHTPTTPVN